MQLRYYQVDAKKAIYDYLGARPGNPCAVLPTGSGKTPLLASICADVAGTWGGRVLVLAHVKELLEQSIDKLRHFLSDKMIGVYSAGLKSRDTETPVIVAGIQSVYRRAGSLGPFALIVVDEAHLIPAHEGGMYRSFIDTAKIVNPYVRIIGLTATPYRLDCGYICGPENVLTEICYEVGVRELIAGKYLCPIRTRAGTQHADMTGVSIRGREYVDHEMAQRMDAIVVQACEEIIQLTADRKSVLIFASSVEHARHAQECLARFSGQEVGFICGDTPSTERAQTIARFRGEKTLFGNQLKYLVNMNVLTHGFDAPNIDAIALLRATLSPGLYYQMVGRGLRKHDSKTDCVILDYGDNAVRHGPIDVIKIKEKSDDSDGEAPAKECPQCKEIVFAGYAVCPACGFEFPPPELKHDTRASAAAILSDEILIETFKVFDTKYFIHHKKNDPAATPTMRVEYATGEWPMENIKKEWVCFEHENFARNKAASWWRSRSNYPVPDTVAGAVQLAEAGALRKTLAITVKRIPGEYPEITSYEVSDEIPGTAEVDAELRKKDLTETSTQLDEWGEPVKSETQMPEVDYGEIPF